MYRALVFDLDNTLLDRPAAQRKWSEEFVAALEDSERPADVTEAVEELMAFDRLGYATREEFARAVSGRYPRSCHGLTVDEFLTEYRRRLIGHYPRDERVCSLVERLGKSYQLGIVSNGRESSQLPKMRQAGLEDQFEAVAISGAIGFEKPHPKPFLFALESLGVSAADALYIGDNPHHDIGGAAAVGMHTCWVALGRSLPHDVAPPDLVIDSILDLEDALCD